jgi:comEA protein
MKFLDAFQEKVGFTRTEAIAVITLSSVLVVGTGIKWFRSHHDHDARQARQFDYTKQDSMFAGRVRAARDSSSRVLNSEARTVKQPKVGSVAPAIININVATKHQLMSLPGIGETYADRIIEHRTLHGEFRSVEGLLNVKGIGKKKLEKLRPFVRTQ